MPKARDVLPEIAHGRRNLQLGDSIVRIARQHGVSSTELYNKLRCLLLESGAIAVIVDEQAVSRSDMTTLKNRIAELERVPAKMAWKTWCSLLPQSMLAKKESRGLLVRDSGFSIGVSSERP